MDYIAKAKQVLSYEINELERLQNRIDDSFSKAVLMLKEVGERHGKIITAGVGKSGNIGCKLAATFSSTGAPAVALNCQDALHGDLGMIDASDIIIALSYTGETLELLNILPHLKRRGVRVIAITGKANSSLAKYSDCVLDVEVEREACPLNLSPTASTTNTLAMGDALAMVLLEARGFKKEHFAELHPGGSLGHLLLTKASDIMRSGDALVLVSEDDLIRNVVHSMTEARSGAALIVNNQSQKLEGIFSHGDFARAFQAGDDIGDRSVVDFMVRNPITTHQDQLVGEVLNFLEHHRIDDLIVVDDENRPQGIIDTQDLSRLRII